MFFFFANCERPTVLLFLKRCHGHKDLVKYMYNLPTIIIDYVHTCCAFGEPIFAAISSNSNAFVKF